MSGGFFQYRQYGIGEIAESIKEVIAQNDSEEIDNYGDRIGCGYTSETIAKFKEAAATLRRARIMAQRVDWLLSGDDGEESFHRRWDEELSALE